MMKVVRPISNQPCRGGEDEGGWGGVEGWGRGCHGSWRAASGDSRKQPQPGSAQQLPLTLCRPPAATPHCRERPALYSSRRPQQEKHGGRTPHLQLRVPLHVEGGERDVAHAAGATATSARLQGMEGRRCQAWLGQWPKGAAGCWARPLPSPLGSVTGSRRVEAEGALPAPPIKAEKTSLSFGPPRARLRNKTMPHQAPPLW
jgi:hypothetical protein